MSIKSQAEQDFVEENIKGRSSWLGMSDSKNEGKWIWLADGTGVGYTHWDGGEPNGGTGKNYAVLRRGGKWNDLNPGKDRYYICKK